MIYSISSSSKNLYFHQLATDAGQTLVERKHFDLETLKQHINDAVSSWIFLTYRQSFLFKLGSTVLYLWYTALRSVSNTWYKCNFFQKVQFEDIDLRDAVNVNAYMDRVTELLREEILIEGLDNIALPDGNLGFK